MQEQKQMLEHWLQHLEQNCQVQMGPLCQGRLLQLDSGNRQHPLGGLEQEQVLQEFMIQDLLRWMHQQPAEKDGQTPPPMVSP